MTYFENVLLFFKYIESNMKFVINGNLYSNHAVFQDDLREDLNAKLV